MLNSTAEKKREKCQKCLTHVVVVIAFQAIDPPVPISGIPTVTSHRKEEKGDVLLCVLEESSGKVSFGLRTVRYKIMSW